MKIEALNKYIVICRGTNQNLYRWHLDLEPWNKAWRVLDQDINPGEIIKGYRIISIEKIKQTFINAEEVESEELEYSEKSISEDEFDFAVRDSGIGFAVDPSYCQTYRCQLCDGVVANDVCTSCMFDWDS